jgi:hypothetical protein
MAAQGWLARLRVTAVAQTARATVRVSSFAHQYAADLRAENSGESSLA